MFNLQVWALTPLFNDTHHLLFSKASRGNQLLQWPFTDLATLQAVANPCPRNANFGSNLGT